MSAQEFKPRPMLSASAFGDGRPRSKTYSKSPYPWRPDQLFPPETASSRHYDSDSELGYDSNYLSSDVGSSIRDSTQSGSHKRRQTISQISQTSVCFTPVSMDFERGHIITPDADGGHLHSLRLVPSCDRGVYHERADAPMSQSIKMVNGGEFSPYTARSGFGVSAQSPYTNAEIENQLRQNHFRSFSDNFGIDSSKRDSGTAEVESYINASPNVLVHSTSFQTAASSGPIAKASFTSGASSPNVVVLGASPQEKHPIQFSSPNFVKLMPSESSMPSAGPRSEDSRYNQGFSPLQPLSPITLRSGAPSSPLEAIIYSDIIPSPPRLSRTKSNWSGHSRRHTVASQSSMVDLMLSIGSPALKSRNSQEQQLDNLLALIEGRKTISRTSHLSMGQISNLTVESFNRAPEPNLQSSVQRVSNNHDTIITPPMPVHQAYRHHGRNLSEAVILEEEQFLRPPSSSKIAKADDTLTSNSTNNPAERILRPASTFSVGAKSFGARSSTSTGFPQWATKYYEGPSRGPSLFARSSSSTEMQFSERSCSRQTMRSNGSEIHIVSNIQPMKDNPRDSYRNSKHDTIRILTRDSDSDSNPQIAKPSTESNPESDTPYHHDPETQWSNPQQRLNEELRVICESDTRAVFEHYGQSPCSTESGRWSPHLTRDRAAPNHLIYVEPPLPLDHKQVKYPYRNQQRIQMTLFVVGFLCPVLWFLGALLPLPKRESVYNEKRASTMHGVFTGEDPYLENARWWQRRNRYISPIGILIIIVFVRNPYSHSFLL